MPPDDALPHAAQDAPLADSLVVMGRIAAAFGVKGWIKVLPLSADPLTLIEHSRWFLQAAGSDRWNERVVDQVREHSGMLVAKISGVDSREAAQVLRGQQVALARSSLPPPQDDEIYVAELAGLRVVNRDGIELGTVQDVQESGAHPLLQVVAADGQARLIPYVDAIVDGVDRQARTISVDWGADY